MKVNISHSFEIYYFGESLFMNGHICIYVKWTENGLGRCTRLAHGQPHHVVLLISMSAGQTQKPSTKNNLYLLVFASGAVVVIARRTTRAFFPLIRCRKRKKNRTHTLVGHCATRLFACVRQNNLLCTSLPPKSPFWVFVCACAWNPLSLSAKHNT